MALAGLALLSFAGLVVALVRGAPDPAERLYGEIVHEARSDFSHIRVRDLGTVRSLLFVDEAGGEFCQSAIDLAAPAELRHGYARGLFASLLYRHPQERVLIVGLGGGGMVRFLQERLPETTVEAVEIDPVVVEIAAAFFGTKPGPRIRIHTEDAFVFFEGERGLYDAIYLDAFLRAPEESGLEAKATRLKTSVFLKTLRGHLKPGGVAAFNLIEADPRTPDDLAAIRAAFPSVDLFAVPGTGNLVVMALRDGTSPSTEDLRNRAAGLEVGKNLGFSLGEFPERRRP